MLQGILFSEKVPLAKVIYWEKGSCLLWLMCLREPSACAMQSLALRYEGPFPHCDLSCCQAACTLLGVGGASLPQLKAERPFLLYPNPGFFSLLCSLRHRAQFIHVHRFISSREFTEQPYTSSLGFKALPSKLKQVWKLVVGLGLGKQLRHFTQRLTRISSAPHLGSLCHQYALESWGIFSSKFLKKLWWFCELHFFLW